MQPVDGLHDSAARVYAWYRVDSSGSSEANGKTFELGATVKGLGSDRVASAVDCSEDGKGWKPLCTGSETRSKVSQ